MIYKNCEQKSTKFMGTIVHNIIFTHYLNAIIVSMKTLIIGTKQVQILFTMYLEGTESFIIY